MYTINYKISVAKKKIYVIPLEDIQLINIQRNEIKVINKQKPLYPLSTGFLTNRKWLKKIGCLID